MTVCACLFACRRELLLTLWWCPSIPSLSYATSARGAAYIWGVRWGEEVYLHAFPHLGFLQCPSPPARTLQASGCNVPNAVHTAVSSSSDVMRAMAQVGWWACGWVGWVAAHMAQVGGRVGGWGSCTHLFCTHWVVAPLPHYDRTALHAYWCEFGLSCGLPSTTHLPIYLPSCRVAHPPTTHPPTPSPTRILNHHPPTPPPHPPTYHHLPTNHPPTY